MKTLRTAVTAVMLVLVLSPSLARAASFSRPSAAYDWLDISLEATAREVDRHGARPTIISRTLAIALTAMYDAWAAYDEKAVGTRLGASLRRLAAERTVANKEKAIAYATYRALVDVYPEDKAWIDSQMRAKGFDPEDASVDPATPQGIGNLAAKAVCAYRHHDGANQFGDEVGSNGVPYSDYTYYAPVNTAEKINDPNRWQPIPFVNPKGGGRHAGISDAALVSGQAVCARSQRSVPRSRSAARRFSAVAEGDGREHRDERGADAGAKSDRRIHARWSSLDGAVGALAEVCAARVEARSLRY
jgi:hypothetical protein